MTSNVKNKKILTIMIMAMLLAVGAVFATIKFLEPKTTQVYIFKDNYTAGTVVTENMLTAIECDSAILVAQKKTKTKDVFVTGSTVKDILTSGDTLRIDVTSGMPLMPSLLSISGGSTIEMNLDPTKVAVTIPITNITGVTNEIKEGSRVNIYATGLESSATTLLFQGVRLLAVNKTGTELTGVTLEVTAEESLKLVNATSISSLYLSLIDGSGYEYLPGDTSYIFQGSKNFVKENDTKNEVPATKENQ